jgi:hypothetical protein
MKKMQLLNYNIRGISKVTPLLFLSYLFLCFGCSKNLKENPYSFLEEENSFQTASDATVAINGVYSRLRTIYNTSYLILSDINADEGTARSDGGASVLEIDRNSYTAANPLFDQLYTNSYLLIDRANRVIKRVPDILMDATKKAQITGEAKFLRALSYFNLVRAFGAVPLILEPSSDVVNVAMPRAAAEDVYAQIIQDLKDAESSNLPEQYTAAGEVGRATIGAVKSIMAKVYLTNKDYANAAAKAKEVIDAKTYSLFADYKDIFPPENKNGMEHIFSVQYSCMKTDYASDMGFNFSIYFSWPIQQGGGSLQAEELFAGSYLNGDYRKAVTIITQKVNPATGALVESRTGSHQDKYWDANPCGASQARNNFMVIRYADVLLIYAEAANELNGPTGDAYTAINEVRARARNGDAAANPQDLSGLTQEQFRDAVLQERSWELCFEGHRRWDLLRTGKYMTILQTAGLPVQDRNILYPIPQNERDVNSELSQNDGY